MRPTLVKIRTAFAAALFTLVTAPAMAAPILFTTSLSGAAESPPVASLGVGTSQIIIDTIAHTLRVIVSFSGLTGTTTVSHVHCCTATPGVGTVAVATELPLFTGFPVGVTSGSYDNTFNTTLASTWNPAFITANGGTPLGAEAAFLTGLQQGRAYLNVHSSFAPGGEIRGFLKVSEPASLALVALALLGVAGFGFKRR